jgi:hypothetical protein
MNLALKLVTDGALAAEGHDNNTLYQRKKRSRFHDHAFEAAPR